jgi:small subunit ribosomal protein S8
MLTIIRNALAVKKETVLIPYSKLKMNIANILANEKFVKKATEKGKKNKKFIEIALFYDKKGIPAISYLKRISKLSQRVYTPIKKVHSVQYGKGIQILSTSKGVMTDKDAKKERIGGEIICEIW